MTIKYSQNHERLQKLERLEIERKFIALDSSIFDQYRPAAS